jgi:hypothetical protein
MNLKKGCFATATFLFVLAAACAQEGPVLYIALILAIISFELFCER